MGFLDRLVADVIARQTGLPVRGLVRRAGVGKLVAAGGMLAAGAAAVDWMQRRQGPQATGGTTGAAPFGSSVGAAPSWPVPGMGSGERHLGVHGPSTASLPPPLSPVPQLPVPTMPPSSVPGSVPPPLPNMAYPAGNGDAEGMVGSSDETSPELRFALARTVIAAALADGVLSDQEREQIEQHLGEATDLPPDQLERLRRDLVLPATVSELARLATDINAATAIFRCAALILRADGSVDRLENTWLSHLGDALGLPAEARERITHEVASFSLEDS